MYKYLIFILIALVILILILMITYMLSKQFHRNYRKEEMDSMEGHDFEYFCADLLKKRGFLDVEVTKGSGDYGIDITAEKDGITYGIQCKCYQDPVGIKAIQEVYFGKDYYEKMVGAVMTNQYFTTPAVDAAKKLRVLLWDRGYIEEMMEE